MTHPCPGCLRVISRQGRCVACGGGTAIQHGYGAEWRRRRAQQLLRHPACQWNQAADMRPCGRAATDVDHIVPKVHGGGDEAVNLRSLPENLRSLPENLRSLCTLCRHRHTAPATTG